MSAPRSYHFNLTVGEPIPPEPLTPLKVAPEGVKYPNARIKDFSSDGTFEILLSKPLDVTSDLREQFMEVKRSHEPIYGEEAGRAYLRNMLKMQAISGGEIDQAQLVLNFTVTSLESTRICFKLAFENALQISQGPKPERLLVTLNMEKFTDADGLSLDRNLELTAFIPRQIPSDA